MGPDEHPDAEYFILSDGTRIDLRYHKRQGADFGLDEGSIEEWIRIVERDGGVGAERPSSPPIAAEVVAAVRPIVEIAAGSGLLKSQDLPLHPLFRQQQQQRRRRLQERQQIQQQLARRMATQELLANPLAVSNPNPLNLVPYSFTTGDYSTECRETYITSANITPTSHVPGIPSPYSQEQLEQRALYILGIPAEWQTPAFRRIFQIYGTVEKCPIIIDLASKSTFRFVIMGTAEECLRAMNSVHGFVLEGNTIFTTAALPSSSLLDLQRLGSPTLPSQSEGEDQGQLTLAGLNISHNNNNAAAANRPYLSGSRTRDKTSTTHGHPSPPFMGLPIVEVQEAELESEAGAQVATRKHRPAPLNLTGTNNISSRRVSPLLPAQSPFPNQVQFESIIETEEPEGSLDDTPTPTQPAFQTQASTWAAIVSSASPSHRNVDLHQPDTPRSGRRLSSIGRIPSMPTIKPAIHEPLSHQARVVLILNIPKTMSLSDISNAVREGPVVCIRFGVDADTGKRFSGIVFQYAHDAQNFYDILRQERADNMPNRFRFIADCVRGDPFPINEDIIAMGAPTYASRRLTIVKKGFFFTFNGGNLQTLCEKVVSKENIQLVFIYNGGNATVVFAEVSAAIKMKARLDQLRESAGRGAWSMYENLQVTFSKDPCELEGGLNLQAADGYHA
ncbi:hypothetical protein DSL72_006248 [Monilinia vaccinii-corymbosi]|uniref:RRM domain-containing protein n=1 Tax=Monilinia vaccinii-corymbosi TaxID=61207 RepID=A0A8A3PLR7_9HELO|nr:hypothetical protein DSL72_006248 [Monilinia vaccinii-corymbosi]